MNRAASQVAKEGDSKALKLNIQEEKERSSGPSRGDDDQDKSSLSKSVANSSCVIRASRNLNAIL
jgi:hypothetical protein